MAYFDYASGVTATYSFQAATPTAALITNTTATTGTSVDLTGSNGAFVVWALGSAATTGGTGAYTTLLQESVDNSSWGTVAAADLVELTAGDLHSVGTAATQRLHGYIGTARYIRAATVITGTPNHAISAVVVAFKARQPTTHQ